MLWLPEIPPQPCSRIELAASVANQNQFRLHFIEMSIGALRAMATSNYGDEPSRFQSAAAPSWGRGALCLGARLFLRLLLSLGLLFGPNGLRGPQASTSEPATNPVVPALDAYRVAKQRWVHEPTNVVAGWEFLRACFDCADSNTNKSERAKFSTEAVQAGRELVRKAPTSAPTHYYLGLNAGQLASTRGLSALSLVDQMEEELQKARDLDPNFDYAGPDRGLGLLYLDAPGWPLSLGSKTKARQHLHRAVELSPDYPENRLNLIEADLRWHDFKDADKQMQATEAIMPKARTNLVGAAWAASWADWDRRWKAAKLQTAKQPGASLKPADAKTGEDQHSPH